MRIVGAIAVDEPSEAGSAASELANDAERPYRIVEHAQRASAAPEHRAAEGEGGAKIRNTAQAKRSAVRTQRGDEVEERWHGVAVTEGFNAPRSALNRFSA